jgi:hypothetical protein
MSATSAGSGEHLPHEQALVCRLRKKTAGRAGNLPTAGEVELENASSGVVAIEVRAAPLQYLNLIVTDAGGQVVSESFYGDLFSPLAEPYTLLLQPGQKYVGPVGLLATVPEAKQRPGMYTVQAVYEYRGFRSVSEPLCLELKSCRDSHEIGLPTSPDGNRCQEAVEEPAGNGEGEKGEPQSRVGRGQ